MMRTMNTKRKPTNSAADLHAAIMARGYASPIVEQLAFVRPAGIHTILGEVVHVVRFKDGAHACTYRYASLEIAKWCVAQAAAALDACGVASVAS